MCSTLFQCCSQIDSAGAARPWHSERALIADLHARAAALFCVGFSGHAVSPELRSLIDRGVRSVILFSRNVLEPPQVSALTRAIKGLADEPIAVAVDQEGGSVSRLRAGFTELPPLRALGASQDPSLARRLGRLLGRELRAVGIDWDFAPVLDVDTNPANPVIGARSLGRDPDLVANLGTELALGIQEEAVAACGKHFPGHGDTELDSHLALPRIAHDLSRLESVELVPFARAARHGIASIMTAHVLFAALDARYPATLSPEVLRRLLRGQLRYDGVVVSDDLEMGAIVDHFGIEDAAVAGVRAGVDIFLVCHSADRAHAAIDAIAAAAGAGAIEAAAFEEASRRGSAFRSRWAAPSVDAPDLGVLRCAEHLEVAALLRRFATS